MAGSAEHNPHLLTAAGGDIGSVPRLKRAIAAGALTLRSLFPAILFLLVACGDEVSGPGRVPTSISVTPQVATLDAIGATQQFDVVVRDQHGEILHSQQLTWTSQVDATASVSSSGVVTAHATGNTNIKVQVGSLSAQVLVSVTQVIASLSKVSGDGQNGVVGSILSQDLVVVARDRLGNPVVGEQIQFLVPPNAGSATVTSTATDITGRASTRWTLGNLAQSASLTAQSVLSPTHTATFIATATAGPATTMAKFAGDGQSAQVGSAVPTLPTVLIADSFGNPVPSANVSFVIQSGGGVTTGGTTTTNAQGHASPTMWQMGNTPGINVLRATSGALAPVDFAADALTGPPAAILILQGNNQSGSIGTALPVVPGVKVSDALGNPISGFAVFFAVTGGAGSVTNNIAVTNSGGIAQSGAWTLGVTPGANSLQVTGNGLPPANFSATGVAVPANIAIHAGNNQAAAVATAVPIAPRVRVTTAQGFAAPNVVVGFVVASGGGSVGAPSVITDADGYATLPSWTLGQIAGINTMTATVASLPQVTFTAFGNAGAPTQLIKVAGDGQSAATNTAVAVPPAVRVEDVFGNIVSGASVNFAVTAGGGLVLGSPAISNASGIATVTSWTLGVAAGVNSLRAQLGALPPVDFSANATVAPASIVIHAGNNQSATVATAVALAPAVRVTDGSANPIQGVTVTFVVASGAGSVAGASAITDASGVATVLSWTLGTVAGANGLSASVAGLPAVNFGATGVAGAAKSIVVSAGNNQTAVAGSPVPVAPAVIVRDNFSNPVSGLTVNFAVTGGGGALTGASPSTSASGIAAVGSWNINLGANSLSATAVGAGITGNPVSFSATGTSASSFNIDLRFLTSVSPSQQAAFNSAVARWQGIITGDIPSATLNLGAGHCGSNSPAINEVVDDLVIYVTLEPIDGAGSVLGSAGPCWVRGGSFLPITGRMRFDVADLTLMESNGILEAVILHEMGHVLGIGTIWSLKGLLQNPSLPSSPGVDTHFSGANAIGGFNSVGGASYVGAKVPVENTQGGSGTRDAHWREGTLATELMTGYVSFSSNPISVITILSLQDLGYAVNAAAADAYTLPGSAILADPGPRLELKGDLISDPIRIAGGGSGDGSGGQRQ